jgi:protein dithiol:quinone oxidoreductase
MRWRPSIRQNCWRHLAMKADDHRLHSTQVALRNQLKIPYSYGITNHHPMTMKTSKPVLVATGFISLALIGAALYLQHVEDMLPCPLCVMQRYAFVAVALICFVTAALPRGAIKAGALLGAFGSLVGAGIAGWHVWIKAHPSVSCGIDPLETSLNKIPSAELMPFLFKADGLCTTDYPPIFGLSLPQWSLFWFAVFALVLLWAALRQNR